MNPGQAHGKLRIKVSCRNCLEACSLTGKLRPAGFPPGGLFHYRMRQFQLQGIEVLCNLKYINHSEDPNACYYDDLSVVALRDIEPHEEITHNYYSNDW